MNVNKYLIPGIVLTAAVGLIVLAMPDVLAAVLIVGGLSAIFLVIFRKFKAEADFITWIFLAGLGVRLLFGVIVYSFELRAFFGGDAINYDYRGSLIVDYWHGLVPANSPELQRSMTTDGPGWGMNYFVAAVYFVFGKNFLAAQSFVAVVGAATGPMVFFCAEKIFHNKRVSRFAAIAVTFFPSFIIWSSQLMKDGLVIFLLVLSITMVLKLQERFNYAALVLLISSLGGIVSLRFYIFYMIAVAVAGSFIIGVTNTVASVARRAAVLVIMGIALTYLGVIRTASVDLEKYADLDRLQNSRLDQSQSESGFGDEIDVSTTEGAITAIPLGFVYLMFAPFPWQVTNLRQAITLPEVFLWWAMIPLMIWGIVYTVRNRLRGAFPIVIFSVMLTLAYSIFQGNVGTAYRQRTQIQVFLFIFIAVGWVLFKERKEDKKLIRAAKQRKFDDSLQAGI